MKGLLLPLLLMVGDAPAMAQSSIEELYQRGVAARYSGEHERAAELLTQVVTVQPKNADAQLHLGFALVALGRLEEAELAFRRTLAIDPDYADARLGLAQIAQKQGNRAAALSELDRLPADYPDADVLREQLNRREAIALPWRLSMGSGYSFLNQGQEDWIEFVFRVAHQASEQSVVSVAVEPSKRFGATDVYGAVRLDHRFSTAAGAYALVGGTPGADHRPQWQIGLGGFHRIRGGRAPLVVTLDLRQSRHRTGDVQILSPGVEQYLSEGKLWFTAKWINVFNEEERHRAGWLARGDGSLGKRLNLFVGVSDAPDTTEGTVIDTFSIFGGLSYNLNERTVLSFSLTRENRPLGSRRTHFGFGFAAGF